MAAVDEKAAASGLTRGQTVADALALSPALKIAEADPEEDLRALTRLADWCARFSPAVAVDPPDGLFFDIEGCAHLWGCEADMMATLLARLAEQGMAARAAIADTFGAAWALARYGADDSCLSSGDHAKRLAPLPVAALRLDPAISSSLRRLGLKTIGHLRALPRAAMRKRFGAELLLQLDHALGAEDEALMFRRAPTPWIERRVFAEGLSAPEDMPRVVEDLVRCLCARLEDHGLGARQFEAAFHRIDGEATRRAIRTALSARDPVRLSKLFAPKLETLDPGFGIEVVTLTADSVEPLTVAQSDFVEAAAGARNADLAPLIDRLRNRLGPDRVWRAAPQESHVPERAYTRIFPLALSTGCGWDTGKPRPIRLFQRPEPIDAIAPVPDDPPVMFRWRGQAHRVRRAEGPERIAAEWWRKPWAQNDVDRVRDYYRVEDERGARFWLFRTGLYGGERPTRWWMHGLFA